MSNHQGKDTRKRGSHYTQEGENNRNNGIEAENGEASMIDKLIELRQKIVESGRPLLTWDEVNEEVARRRGGIE